MITTWVPIIGDGFIVSSGGGQDKRFICVSCSFGTSTLVCWQSLWINIQNNRNKNKTGLLFQVEIRFEGGFSSKVKRTKDSFELYNSREMLGEWILATVAIESLNELLLLLMQLFFVLHGFLFTLNQRKKVLISSFFTTSVLLINCFKALSHIKKYIFLCLTLSVFFYPSPTVINQTQLLSLKINFSFKNIACSNHKNISVSLVQRGEVLKKETRLFILPKRTITWSYFSLFFDGNAPHLLWFMFGMKKTNWVFYVGIRCKNKMKIQNLKKMRKKSVFRHFYLYFKMNWGQM